MKVMLKKWQWISLLVSAVLMVVFVMIYKVEDLGDTCANTGSTVRYKRYFSIYTTEKRLTESWVELALLEAEVALPDRDWRRTIGNTYTFGSMVRVHGAAPLIYSVRNLEFKMIRESLGDAETLELAKKIAFGDEAERKAAIELALNVEWL